jgi:hypothetical protein
MAVPPLPATLCAACKEMFHGTHRLGDPKDESSHRMHHPHLLNLEKNGQEGCHFCAFLWGMLTEEDKAYVVTQVGSVSENSKDIKEKPAEEESYPFATRYFLEESISGGYGVSYYFMGKPSKSDSLLRKLVTLSPASGRWTRLFCSLRMKVSNRT